MDNRAIDSMIGRYNIPFLDHMEPWFWSRSIDGNHVDVLERLGRVIKYKGFPAVMAVVDATLGVDGRHFEGEYYHPDVRISSKLENLS